MKKTLLMVGFCCAVQLAFGQNIQKFIAEESVQVVSIDPDAADFSDLERLGEAIGSARIVMLGEQDHGDAPTFEAKTRIIRYLHEQKGFHVLAFESDFFGFTQGWDPLPKDTDSIQQFLRKNIFSIWTHSDACQYLFQEYIPNSFELENPLQVTGFDSQFYLNYSSLHLETKMKEFLEQRGLHALFTEQEYKDFLAAVHDASSTNSQSPSFPTLVKGSHKILDELDGSEVYWERVFKSLLAFGDNAKRDQEMAENLRYLVEQVYPDQKMIIWAANGHIMKYTDQIQSNKKGFDQVIWKTMGTIFTQELGYEKETYVLGFTCKQGTAGRLGMDSYQVQPAVKNSVESYFPSDWAFGFLDFTSYNEQYDSPDNPFQLKGRMHYSIPKRVAKIAWNLVYDGVFYIRDMYPVKPVEQAH